MDELENLGSIPRALMATVLLWTAAWGAGLGFHPRVFGRKLPAWEFALLRTILGINLLSFVGVILGFTKLLAQGRSIGMLVGLSLFAVVPCLRRCHKLSDLHVQAGCVMTRWQAQKRLGKTANPGSRSAEATRFRGRLSWISGSLTFLLLGLTLGPGLCYPTGWDELVYHGVLPRRWLLEGRLEVYADLPYSGFPSSAEILFWLIAPWESLIAPRLVNWTWWVMALVILFRLQRHFVPAFPALILTLAIALSPAALLISANCYVETLQLMNLAALLRVFSVVPRARNSNWPQPPRAREGNGHWLLAAGILLGGSAAVKLTGLSTLCLPWIWWAGSALDRSQRKAWAYRMGAIWVIALLYALPFYLRPALATGNPFYPYFDEWFCADPARRDMSRYHHELGSGPFGLPTLVGLFAGPWLLAMEDRLYDGSLGWQHLVLLLLGAGACLYAFLPQAGRASENTACSSLGCRIHKLQRQRVRWLAAVALWFYTFWFATSQQARFVLPAALTFSLVSGAGLRHLWRAAARSHAEASVRSQPSGTLQAHHVWRARLAVRGVLGLLLLLSAVSFPWRTLPYYLASWETVARWWTWSEYVDDGTGGQYIPLVQTLRTHIPQPARLLLLFEHRGLYLPRPYLIGTPFFQPGGFTPPEQFARPEALLEFLQREGITHMVMTKSLVGPDRSPAWFERLEPLFRGLEHAVAGGHLEVTWTSEDYVVFAVKSSATP